MNQQIKRVLSTLAVSAIALAPMIAFAQAGTNPFGSSGAALTNLNGTQLAAIGTSGTGQNQLPVIIGRVINIVLGFLGVVLLFYVLLAGFKWMTAGGSEKGATEAKEMIKNAVIGMVIIVAGFAISNFVISQLATLTTA